jgi:hypothetical protein
VPGTQLVHLGHVDIEADDREAAFGKRRRQRQADVPQADDTDDGPPRREALDQRFHECTSRSIRCGAP